MSQLVEYDKDNIAPSVVALIRPYLDRKEFDPEVGAARPGADLRVAWTHLVFCTV